jgi:hypothetical protein
LLASQPDHIQSEKSRQSLSTEKAKDALSVPYLRVGTKYCRHSKAGGAGVAKHRASVLLINDGGPSRQLKMSILSV